MNNKYFLFCVFYQLQSQKQLAQFLMIPMQKKCVKYDKNMFTSYEQLIFLICVSNLLSHKNNLINF